MNSRKAFLSATLLACLFVIAACRQPRSCDADGKQLNALFKKVCSYCYDNSDSLVYYSELFSRRLTDYVTNDPATLDCDFKSLTDSVACKVVTSADGTFRIYSWNTELGGTMSNYRNIFQFRSNGVVRVKTFDHGEYDMGTYFTDVFTVEANGIKYFLGYSGGSLSSKLAYENLQAFKVAGDSIDETVKLFKTENGLENSLQIGYDVTSLRDNPSWNRDLMLYDKEKMIISIPVVMEDGTVTQENIRYGFTGQYFERLDPVPE